MTHVKEKHRNAVLAKARELAVWGQAHLYLETREENPAVPELGSNLSAGTDMEGRYVGVGDREPGGEPLLKLRTPEFVRRWIEAEVLLHAEVRQGAWTTPERAKADEMRATLAGNGPSIWISARRDGKNIWRRLLSSDWDGTHEWDITELEREAEGLTTAVAAAATAVWEQAERVR